MAMRPEDREKLTAELIDELGPAGFLLRATEVYIRANAPEEVCGRDECVRRVGTRASELAMRACMDEGQPNILGRAITALTEYTSAVCDHPAEELPLADEEFALASV